jgi:hypothetical protein
MSILDLNLLREIRHGWKFTREFCLLEDPFKKSEESQGNLPGKLSRGRAFESSLIFYESLEKLPKSTQKIHPKFSLPSVPNPQPKVIIFNLIKK